MNQVNVFLALEHVRARAILHQREVSSLDAEMVVLQKELDELEVKAPGPNNDHDKKVARSQKINALQHVIGLADGRRIAAQELAKTLDGLTDINAMLEKANELARAPFPTERHTTRPQGTLEGYYAEINDVIGVLSTRSQN